MTPNIRIPLRAVALALFCGLAGPVSAAWYWPFDLDPDSTNKPPRLHRLLEKANEYIELAEDEALDGDGDKAVENYRAALREIDRIEAEHPERAKTSEFAPLRNKRASCTAAIDAIRFAQVNENERAVSVTNTRDLERRWRKKHNMLTPEDLAAEKAAPAAKSAEQAPPPPKPSAAPSERKAEAAAPTAKAEPEAPPQTAQKAERKASGAVSDKEVETALAEIRRGDYVAADLLLERLLRASPTDLRLLLLRAAAQSGMGRDYAARRTLERAARAHPASYLPPFNLAQVSLKLGEKEAARRHYDRAREAGAPQSAELEEKLK